MPFEYLPFIDSFDHWGTGDTTRKWTVGSGAIVTGRNGNGVRLSTGDGLSLSKTFSLDYSTLYGGVAYKTTAFGNAPITFGSIPDPISFRLNNFGDGRLTVVSGSSTSAPSTFVLTENEFHYLELAGSIVSLGGTSWRFDYEARVNEATILSGSFTRTMAAGFSGGANVLTYTGPGGGENATFDDAYLVNTAFKGDLRIGVIRPDADGTYSEWTPNAGAIHFDRLNEHDPDDDTTYVEAGTTGLRDIHNYEDIGVFPILITQMLACCKKSDAGTGQVQSLLRNGAGTEFPGAVLFWPSDASYLYYREGYETSPFTGVAWTSAEINALQYGLTRTL